MANYKIANIKYLRDLGWEIADTYSDSFCPTYSDIADIPISGIASVSVNETCTATSAAYASNQLVCEVDITVTLCYAPDIAVASETWINYNKIELNLGFVDTSVKALLTQQDGSIIKIPVNGDDKLLGSETHAYSATTVSAYVGPTVTTLRSGTEGLSTFENFPNLESVILNDSVKKIMFGAFSRCTKITNLDFLNKVENIGSSDFKGCTGLVGEITVPDNVKYIGPWVFENCTNITKLKFNDSSKLETFQSSANHDSVISGCTSLTSIEFPKSLKKIGQFAFVDCPSLTSVTFPSDSQLTILGNKAFSGDTGLEHITLPNSLTIIGGEAFHGTSLKEITIPNSVTEIQEAAFRDVTSLTGLTLGNGLTKIGRWVFEDCTGITGSITMQNIVEIGYGAFDTCKGITSISIGDSITTIDGMAFYDCSSLTSCTIGSGVTSIGNYAFSGCRNLTGITCKATTPANIHMGVFNYTNNCPIYVPAASVNAYKTAEKWSDYADRIQAIP